MRGLTTPFRYYGGVITDGANKTVIEANRTNGETPLCPADRDDLLRLACYLLNEAFETDKADRILSLLNRTP